MQLDFRELPTHPNLKLGIRFADWDRKSVNGNSVGMFLWVSSSKGRPACQELLLRDGDHCIAKVSTFHDTQSVLSDLCPDKSDSSVFIHLCINRLILRREGSISVLVTDELGMRHHLGTIEFRENTFNESEKPTIRIGARPILISSLGRSGSTVLANSIGLHPEVCLIGGYPFEYRFFSYCLHATYILTSPANHESSMPPGAFEKINIFNTGFNPFNIRVWDRLFENDDLRNFYETKFTHDTAAHFMHQANTAIEKITSRKKTATSFVEKAVGTNLSNLAENIFPNLKEIVLIRNFWDMALSMIAFDAKRGTKSFYSENPDDWLIARAYQHCNLTIRSRIEGKILVVYEDLIKNPKLCLTELAGKLNLKQDAESINAMLEAFKESSYLSKHKTSQDKKLEIRKWFSEEAVQAAEMLLIECKNNEGNTNYELATWTGDTSTPTETNGDTDQNSTKKDPMTANWVEAFAWAADLKAAITTQNSAQLKLKTETLEKIRKQSLEDSKNHAKKVHALVTQLGAVELRAQRAEVYAKTLEDERIRFNDYIRNKEAILNERGTLQQDEITNLKKNFESQILAHSERARRAELYSASMEIEIEKYRLKLSSLKKALTQLKTPNTCDSDYEIDLEDTFLRSSSPENNMQIEKTQLNQAETICQSKQTSNRKKMKMNQAEAERLVHSHPHWHHKFEIFPNVITPGSYNPKFLLDKLELPANLTGKSVLDIGACDGYFSAELFERGANVTALDYRPKTASGFAIMEEIKGISIPHIVSSVYDIDRNMGEFDIILLLGVIYHLPDISSALWKIRKICKGTIFVESYVEDFGIEKPMARYYEAATLNEDSTNFWAPNIACMESMLRDCGFIIKNTHKWGDRAMIEAEANGSDSKIEMAYGSFT